jgi:uncharacterized membrane protein
MSVILIIIGGAATWFSFWLLLHISDKKMLRRFRPRWSPKMSKSDTEAYRSTNIALVAVVLMAIGSLMLIAGVLRLFGLAGG